MQFFDATYQDFDWHSALCSTSVVAEPSHNGITCDIKFLAGKVSIRLSPVPFTANHGNINSMIILF